MTVLELLAHTWTAILIVQLRCYFGVLAASVCCFPHRVRVEASGRSAAPPLSKTRVQAGARVKMNSQPSKLVRGEIVSTAGRFMKLDLVFDCSR